MKQILVVGGGISGITTAVEVAEVGHEVILIEKLPYLGGKVAKMNNYFPKLCPPSCGLEINFKRIKQNQRIAVHTSTEIDNISGEKGNFTVTLKHKPQIVNDQCTACGECEQICPIERDDEFNFSLNKTLAAYLPHEMAFPWKYQIDETVCLKEKCNKCLEVCKYNAINLDARETTKEINVASIVFATGWEPYDAKQLTHLKFGDYKNITTNILMERLLSPNGPSEGEILCSSEDSIPKEIAFVQCAGSRDENHLPYCSAVCCSASLKQALTIREKYPDSKIKIFYIDLRVSGRNEDFLSTVKADKNIELIKGKVAKIDETENGNLIVEAEDILSGKKSKAEVNMVVLATGIEPAIVNGLQEKCDQTGFIRADLLEEGIFATACAKKPMDVSSSLKDATGAALKAIQQNI